MVPEVLVLAARWIHIRALIVPAAVQPARHRHLARHLRSRRPTIFPTARATESRHLKFGEGTVQKIADGGKDFEVTVNFDRVGVKKMFASFAKLVKC